ncbi:MAG: leucine-rich repeat domain-containing protein [Planctomycetes bacterium]|nr:leucine-rich repeat domain-containing protein [Planctomycetota bacterium]
MAGNICVWVGLLAFTFWYTGPKCITGENGQKTEVPRSLGLSDLFLVVALIAFFLGQYSWIRKTYNEQESLRFEIEQAGGWVDVSRSIPLPIQRISKGRFDDWLVSWNRITGVTIENPEKELLEKIVSLPHLEVLRLAGDRYPLASLKPLEKRYALRELRISGRSLDDETAGLIGRLKSLQKINLMRTNVHRRALEAWGDMPRLRLLTLVHTDVALDGEQPIPSMNTLYSLLLPHSPRGQSVTHRIAGLSQLQQLTCIEYDERLNATPVRLIVEDCPALRTITVDTAQKLDLELRRLPVLETVQNYSFLIGERVHRRSIVPNGVWVRKAVLEDLPSLTKMPLFIRNLEQIEVSNCNTSGMGLNALGDVFVIEKKGFVPVHEMIQSRLAFDSVPTSEDSDDEEESWLTPTANDTQQMINALVSLTKLNQLPLRYRDLTEVDLSILAKYASLKTVDLAWAKITKEQLEVLATIPTLEELRFWSIEDIVWREYTEKQFLAYSMLRHRDVRGLSSDQIDLKDILAAFPKLRFLRGDSLVGRVFDVKGHRSIESLFDGNWSYALDIEIMDNPKLRDTVVFSPSLERLQIRRTPELRGILLTSPWPRAGVVEDCSKLRSITLGGHTLDEVSWRSFDDLRSLESLTIAHTNLAGEALQRIGQASKLLALCACGSAVNDSVVKAWASIRDLEILDLRETRITAESLEWIRSQSPLKDLAIDLSVLQGASREALEFLGRLQRLTLRGGTLDAGDLRQWPSMPSLREWRLQQVTLPADGAAVLSERDVGSLTFFDLDHCTIDVDTSIGWLKKCIKGNVVCSILETVIDSDVEDTIVKSKLAGCSSNNPFLDVATPGFERIASFGDQPRGIFEEMLLPTGANKDWPWSAGRPFIANPELYRDPIGKALP